MSKPNAGRRYGVALLTVCASTLVTFALRPVFGPQAHYMTFTLAVIASAWYGGLGPGLLATLTGFLSADYFFIGPAHSLTPLETEDVAVLAAVGVSVSVLTERLSAAQAKLSLATSATGVGLFEWAVNKERVKMSPELASIYGLDDRYLERAAKDFIDCVLPEDARRTMKQIRRSFAKREPEMVHEFRIKRANGEIRSIEARSRVFYNRFGRPTRVFGANIDVTERRNRELERERLIESEHKALREAERARKELAEANVDLQRFAAAASHDLQAPLRTIGLYAEVLVQRAGPALDAESRKLAASIVNSVHQMRNLVQGLLAFCQASFGELAPGVADSDAALRGALDNLAAAIEESGAEIVASPLPLPMVQVNEEQLLQVFQNLVENAMKYRGPEPPRIRISARRLDGLCEFAVADNGIGIDPKYHERIFGVFERLHRYAEYEGAGIGLATVRRVVERTGGRVWVQSEPGKGSTFFFTLPESNK